jgi:hypothetical protein
VYNIEGIRSSIGIEYMHVPFFELSHITLVDSYPPLPPFTAIMLYPHGTSVVEALLLTATAAMKNPIPLNIQEPPRAGTQTLSDAFECCSMDMASFTDVAGNNS